MLEQSFISQPASPDSDASSDARHAEGDFRQIFARISARIGSPKSRPETQPHTGNSSASAESQLAATKEALAKAHVSLVQIGLELEVERHARQDAEAKSRAEQHACREAMQLLEHTVQPLRDFKAAAAEHARQTEQQSQEYAQLESRLFSTQEALEKEAQLASDIRLQIEAEHVRSEDSVRTHAELAAKHSAIETQLQETEAALTQALNVATQLRIRIEGERITREEAETKAQVERTAREDAESKVSAERLAREDAEARIQAEQLAREHAEARARTEQHAREAAEQALRDVQSATDDHTTHADDQARAYAELELRHQETEAKLLEREGALTRSLELAARLERLVETDRLARQEAENRVHTEREARERTESVLLEVNHWAAVQGAQAEDHTRAYTRLEAQRQSLDAQLKEAEAALARANYAAERHSQRHAQITSDLEKQRSAREDAERKLTAERRAREEAVEALARHSESPGFWGKLVRGTR